MLQFIETRSRVFIFAAALLFALCVQGFMVVAPIADRSMPVELDDALVYEVKAAQMAECFTQNCPGLESLVDQLDLQNADPANWPVFRMARSFLHVYHPGHSILLVALERFGLSWESAFNVVRVAGSIFIVCSIGFWAFQMFGPSIASLFLMLFAVTVFPEQGIHVVTPGNMTTGMAFLLLGLVAQDGRRVEVWLLIGTIAMLLWHTVGIVLGTFVWGFYFISKSKRGLKRRLVFSTVAALLVLMAFFLPTYIERPLFQLPLEYRPEGYEFWSEIYKNLDVAKSAVGSLFLGFNIGRIAVLPVSIIGLWGFVQLFNRNNESAARFFALSFCCLCLSIFMIFPAHAGLLFNRLWIFMATLGQAFFAAALLDLAQRIMKRRSSAEGIMGNRRLVQLLFAATCALFLSYMVEGISTISGETETRTVRNEYNPSHSQVAQLVQISDNESYVYYYSLDDKYFSARVPMLFSYTHGGLNFLSMTDFIPYPSGFARGQSVSVGYGWNPLFLLSRARRHGVVIKADEELIFELENSPDISDFEINLAGFDLGDNVHVTTYNHDRELDIHKLEVASDWQRVELSTGKSVTRIAVESTGEVDVVGLRFENNSNLNWAIDQISRVVHRFEDDLESIDLKSALNSTIQSSLNSDCEYRITNDDGTFLLLALSNCTPK